ncbi:unnamed protein product [Meganyctiphanes norvegica]|uniref:EGF-like domain-containing protein n=1 Tax=Meganyctiphanes norvegica TaxID=48144 RepID=A0AAV2R9U0_MEGNR
MCGVVAEGSSYRICQQQHSTQTPRATYINTGVVIHGIGSSRIMTHSPEEVHRRWWWRRGPGIEPQTSTASSQPQHTHCAVENSFPVQPLHRNPSSRLSCPPDEDMAEVLITCRRADTTCSSVNKTYARSSRSSSLSRLANNDGDSSKYQLGSRELQCNNVNERLCTDTLEQNVYFCNEHSSLESGCNVGLRYSKASSESRKASSESRKASSDCVETVSKYSSNDSTREFSSLSNNSVIAAAPVDSANKLRCSSAVRSSKNRSFCGLSSQQWIVAVTILFLASFTGIAESCSSRSTPKPRPPSPTSRPNVTFLTYACPPAYAAWYCLNGATCFTVKIGDSILYNCECADGYMGQRCEFKDLDGSYLPARDKVLLQTASIAGGATLAVVLVFIVLFSLYVVRQRDKEKYDDENSDRKPFSGYQNLHSECLTINNPYVQIEDLSDVKIVKIVPPSGKKNLQDDGKSSNIKNIICNNMNDSCNIIHVSGSNNKKINSLLTPS